MILKRNLNGKSRSGRFLLACFSGKRCGGMTKPKFDESIDRRYLLALLAMCALLAAALFIYIRQLRNTIEKETRAYLEECGGQSAQNISADLMLLLDSTTTLGDFLGRTYRQPLDMKLAMALAQQRHNFAFSRFGVAGPDGRMVTDDGHQFDVRDRGYFTSAMFGIPEISPLLVSKCDGSRVIVFSAPISSEGDVRGVLCAAISPADYNSAFNVSLFGGEGRTYVVTADGDAVLTQDGSPVKKNISEFFNDESRLKQLLNGMKSQKNGVIKNISKGSEYYVGYTNLHVNGWYLLSVIPSYVVNRRFIGFSNVTLCTAIFLLFFFTGLMLLVGKRLSVKNRRLKSAMKELAASDNRYKVIMENTDEYIFEWTERDNSIYFSPSYIQKFGIPKFDSFFSEANDNNVRVYPDDRPGLTSLLQNLKDGNLSGDMELRLLRLDGVYRWCSLKAVALDDGASRRIVGLLKDIDDEHRERQRLVHLAQTDKFTGLYDKQTTQDQIDDYLNGEGQKGRHSLILIDIDDFKRANDTYGHVFGDHVLLRLADGIRTVFRSDDIKGRVGGDEFVVLLKNAAEEGFLKRKAHEFAEMVRHCTDDTDHHDVISVSLGIAIYPQDANNFPDLYKTADDALYLAKNSGRNTYGIARRGGKAQLFKCDERERGLSLLLAGGSVENRSHLNGILETEYSIVEAEDCEKAVQLLHSTRDIGAVIICAGEINPGIVGRLKNCTAAAEVPLIVVASVGQTLHAVAAASGIADFLSLPFDAEEVRSRVRNTIARSVLAHLEKEKQLHSDLSEVHSSLQSVVDTVPCGIVMLKLKSDGSMEQTFFSDAFCRLSGYPRAFVAEKNLLSFVIPEDLPILKNIIKEILEKGNHRVHCSFRIHNIDNQVRWLEMTGEQFGENAGEHMFSLILIDTTEEVERRQEQQRQAEILRYKSRHDPLTNIYNRATFFEEALKIIAANPGRRYVMICSDIDRFSVVNDLFGNNVGDRVLQQILENLLVRANDQWRYGRIGGDVFAVCLPYESLDLKYLEKISKCGFPELGDKYELTLRFGVYVIDEPGLPANVMCDRAVMALRTVKGSYSKHVAVYSTEIRNKMLREQEIVSDMEHALENGEFEAWLQPIFNLADERPACAEALVRWKRPDHGLLMPGAFIPLFEQNGFITRLDAFVWEQACIRMSQLEKLGLELPISVNMSRLNFYSCDVVSVLEGLTQKYGIPPSRLHLEVTESTYSENPGKIGEAISSLRSHGFILMVDDFGSGWSTLNMIKEAPMDILKIDRNLIKDIDSSPRNRLVVESVVRMVKSIGMTVIAEGVETVRQAEVLKEMNCDMVQGYYYAKPMPWNQFVTSVNVS